MSVVSYAYIHCKPDGTPFYVGKGALRRAKYLGERNPHHQATVKKYGSRNILIGMLDCSTSDIAYELEAGIIKCFNRMGIPLTNFTAGGDGGRSPCEATRKRLSEAAKKRGVSEACHLARIRAKTGKPLSEEQKEKQSVAMRGKVFTEEHRRNIGISAKKRGVGLDLLEKAWASTRGRVQSPEERAMRSAALKAYHAKKREEKLK